MIPTPFLNVFCDGESKECFQIEKFEIDLNESEKEILSRINTWLIAEGWLVTQDKHYCQECRKDYE